MSCRRRPVRLLLASLASLATLVATSASAVAAEPLPVPYDAPSFVAGGYNPDDVPGANDFACQPSRAHPHPVVLVHGLGATLGDNWRTMSPLLKNNGFCVFGLTYGRQPGFDYTGGVTRMEDSAKELAAFVDKVLAATGARRVDLLGHSEGTVMPRWYLSFLGGAPKVDKYVQLTPLWDGSNLAGIGELLTVAKTLGLEQDTYRNFGTLGCGSCPQFARGSEYLTKVNAAGPAVPGVSYTGIVTEYDELVQPYTSGLLAAPNVKNIVLQDVCATDYSEHLAVAYSPVVAQLVLNALAPAQALPPVCTLVTPLGTPNPPKVGLGPEPPAPSALPATRCAVIVSVRPRRGERIRRIRASAGGRTLATRRGRALRTIRVPGLKPGRRAIRLRVTSSRGTRTVSVTRTVRCAGR